jgi:hypothetical protein
MVPAGRRRGASGQSGSRPAQSRVCLGTCPPEPVDTTSTRTPASKLRGTRDTAPARSAEAVPSAAPKPGAFAPVEYFFTHDRPPATGRARHAQRLSVRLGRDPQFLLAVAIALPALAVEGTYQLALPWLAVAVPILFVAAQATLSAWRASPPWLAPLRFGLSLAFVVAANIWLDPTGTWPLSALAVPVVALAASRGDRGSVAVAVAGMASILVPLAVPNADPGSRQQTLSLGVAAAVVAYGCRRVVDNLERSTDRLRQANTRDRRHARQLSAVETVGRSTSGTATRCSSVRSATIDSPSRP